MTTTQARTYLIANGHSPGMIQTALAMRKQMSEAEFVRRFGPQ